MNSENDNDKKVKLSQRDKIKSLKEKMRAQINQKKENLEEKEKDDEKKIRFITRIQKKGKSHRTKKI